MKFRKITALAGSVLMAGLTVATAAAATYPAPFVENGVADAAIVYGTGTGVSSTDLAQAGNIQSSLSTFVDSDSTTTVEGGEAFTLEKSSDKFNFGDDLDDVYSTLDEDELSDALADGTYDDGAIDEDYSQEITLGTSHTLKIFSDEDVNDEEPTIGFVIDKSDTILSYTMDFDGNGVNYSEMAETNMPLLGSEYYVMSATTSEITLLDTAEQHVLDLGATATIGDKEVIVEYIGTNEVKFTVDGVATDSLAENEEYELDDGSYIIPTDIMASTKDSVTDSVEFSIGSGKIVLSNDGDEVQVNDEDVDGLESTYTIGDDDEVDSIVLTWVADEDTFLYEGETLTMPLFEKIKVAYNGLDFPTESETISFTNGDTLTIEMDNFDIPVMWTDDGSTATFGEENHELITALEDITYAEAGYIAATNASSNGDTNSTWNITLRDSTVDQVVLSNASAVAADALAETYLANVLPVMDDERFIATDTDEELSEVETLYYEVDSLDADDSTTVLKLTDMVNDDDLEFDEEGDENDRADITVTLEDFNVDEDTAYLSFTNVDAYNKIVSDTGLVITLPASAGAEDITFQEANEDGDLEQGTTFKATVGLDSEDDTIDIASHNVTTEEESDDVYVGYVASELASKVTFDKSADENDFEVEYYGEEVTADVQVIIGGEVSTSTTGALGDVIVKDSEVSTVSANNLVIVGGSCINSAAATVLGGNYCGESFTAATDVSANEFLIKGFEDSAIDGKFALVVAGYEAADTANAVTYLTNKDVDTSKAYKGTSATSAEVMVA